MLGAIIGDIVGSAYEFNPWKGDKNEFPLFTDKSKITDDTVMTCAIVHALIIDKWKFDSELRDNMINNFHNWGRTYYDAGYGRNFAIWIKTRSREPYNSFGNGSAMRVSPVGWYFKSLSDVEHYARLSAEITHNHPEGIKGAQAVAGAIYLARTGASKDDICNYVTSSYGYNIDRNIASIRDSYKFDETCQGSIPEAIIAFLESNSFESAIRNAVYLGGDADTQAAIAGSIAEAFYGGVPEDIKYKALWMTDSTIHKMVMDWEDWLEYTS